jgi:hypothetical protein
MEQVAERKKVEAIEEINWASDLDGVDIQSAINYFEQLKKKNYLSIRLDIQSTYDGYESKVYVTRYENDHEISARLKKEEVRRINQLEGEAKAKAKAERLAREEEARKIERELKERELLAVLKAKYEK